MTQKYKHNSLAIKAPELQVEWHPDNDKESWTVAYGSNVKYKWICHKGHTWPASPHNRAIAGSGCPECAKTATPLNSLAVKAPWLEKEWHPDNKEGFCYVPYSSNIDRKWICCKGHVWWASPNNRAKPKRPTGCPRCPKISVVDRVPELEKEWSPNNKEKCWEVAYSSNTLYEWVCSKNPTHIWSMTPGQRTHPIRASGCPWCSGNRVSELNSLATKAPWLEKEWHPDNEKKFYETAYGSDIKCKWRCTKGHVFWASPGHRTHHIHPSGCPECVRRRSRSELSIFEVVRQKYPDAVNGQRGLFKHKGMELDIYVPSLKKAIEFDGTYWHSLPGCEERDQRKNEQCAHTGIQLLRIPEAEYESDPTGTIEKIIQWLDIPTSPVP